MNNNDNSELRKADSDAIEATGYRLLSEAKALRVASVTDDYVTALAGALREMINTCDNTITLLRHRCENELHHAAEAKESSKTAS